MNVKFMTERVPDTDPYFGGQLMVTWCEVHGMYGLSAPTREELQVKVNDEVAKRQPDYKPRPMADFYVKFR